MPLDYWQCTKEELQTFITARKLTLPASDGARSQRDMVECLHAGDEAATFPLMDLIPELRNAVYGELLTLRTKEDKRSQRMHCYPQMLAASKQINEEARDILFCDNVFEVAMEIWPSYPRGLSLTTGCTMNGEDWSHADCYDSQILTARHLKPHQYLLRARHFSVRVEMHWDIENVAEDCFGDLPFGNRLLYGLSCFLQHNRALQSLKVKCSHTGEGTIPTKYIQDYLWPTSRLFSSDKIEITGLDENIIAGIRESSTSAPVPDESNIVGKCERLMDAAQGTAQTISFLRADRTYVCNLRDECSRVREVINSRGPIGADRHRAICEAYSRLKALYLRTPFLPDRANFSRDIEMEQDHIENILGS